MSALDILPGTEGRDRLGEGPLWWEERSALITIDVVGWLINGTRLDGSRILQISTPSEPGFIARHVDGRLIVGLRDRISTVDPDVGTFGDLIDGDFDSRTLRINDGAVDRNGRLWFGTMDLGETSPTGILYRSDGEGAQRIRSGSVVSNGIDWNPDDTVLYHADSGLGRIAAYDYHSDTGELDRPRVLVQDDQGLSDGLAVDAEGCIWSAKWDGACVVRYSPDGRELSRIDLPVDRPTSCAFVGDGLALLAITSAQPAAGAARQPLAGSVFLTDVGVRGTRQPLFTPSGPAAGPPPVA